MKIHKHAYELVPVYIVKTKKWMWHCMKCGRNYKRSPYGNFNSQGDYKR